MPGRRRLRGGAVRLLGRHDGLSGRAFRRAYNAIAQELDLSSPLAKLEASRVAAAWSVLEASTKALEDARRARINGRGRRPALRDLERAARRQGLADATFSQGLAKLRELYARKPEDVFAALVRENGKARATLVKPKDDDPS